MSSIANFSLPDRIYGHDFIIMGTIATLLLVTHFFASDTISLITITVLILIDAFAVFFWLGDSNGTNKEWVYYLSVSFGSFFVGLIQLDLILSFVLVTVIFIRAANASYNLRALLPLIMLIMISAGYMLNISGVVINFLNPLFTKDLLFTYFSSVLILVSLILIDWMHLNSKLIKALDQFKQNKQRIRNQVQIINNLTRFIPKQTWRPIVQGETPAHLFNKRIKLTIFFSDIVNFTELSDNLDSDALANLLSQYMNVMTSIANDHGATLDKFIGDGMMCFFEEDDTKDVRDNALRCVNMAIHMRREMRLLRKKWKEEGFDSLWIRIGINTGFCHLGNFGTELRMSYTVLGKEVNLASRLESAALPDQILVSNATYEYISHEHACVKQQVSLKGLENVTTCWQVLDPDDSSIAGFQWLDYNLPGFNLHLNLKNAETEDYEQIKKYLEETIKRINYQEEQKKYGTIEYKVD